MNHLTNDPLLCAEDPHQQATFSDPSELGWVGSPRYRLSNLGRLCVYRWYSTLLFEVKRWECSVWRKRRHAKQGGGASKSYGKGTFCLFAIMICINKSAPDKHISVHTFKSTGLPYLINEVLDILPLPQNTNTLGWITNENFYFIFYFLSL